MSKGQQTWTNRKTKHNRIRARMNRLCHISTTKNTRTVWKALRNIKWTLQLTKHATKSIPEMIKPKRHRCIKASNHWNQCLQLERGGGSDGNRESAGKKNNGQKYSNSNNKSNNSNTNNVNNNNNANKKNNANNRAERKPGTAYPPCETKCKANHSTENCYFGAVAVKWLPPCNRRPSHVQQYDTQSNEWENFQESAQPVS